MDNNNLSIHGKLLASLIGHSIRGTSAQNPSDKTDWEALYKLAVFHNVVSLIWPVVSKLDIPDSIRQKFNYDNHRYMAREARQELESQRVFNTLIQNGISFIKLKGIVIKNLYPLPYMRTQSDVDICMTAKDREKATKLMESLGYSKEGSIDYHDEYAKDNFFIYEIHSDIMSPKSDLYPLFINPFEKSLPDTSPNQLVLTNEYFYLNLVTHLYKHFISEGCGLRLFADLYVFRRTHPDTDYIFVNKALKEYDLYDFHETVLKLISCFFEGNKYTDTLDELAEFIFKNGEYGDSELKRLSWLSSGKSAKLTFRDKAKYFLGNWFPGTKVLKKRYPVLEKAPFLLPVCWVRRIFYTIFFKRSALKEQYHEIQRLNSDKLKEAKRIRHIAGIK